MVGMAQLFLRYMSKTQRLKVTCTFFSEQEKTALYGSH